MLILTILTLMSGKQMEVEVVYQDEQVLVVQDRQSGQRFQYPRSEIKCLEEERSGEEAVLSALPLRCYP
mgnify:CR=1 FL=1